MVDAKVHLEVNAAEKVVPGRTPARKTKRVKAAPEEAVREVIAFCRQHAKRLPRGSRHGRERRRRWLLLALAMEVHWESGMRPGELVQMRPCDLSVSDDREYWIYIPQSHKTEHHDEERRIYLNAMAQLSIREAIELNQLDGNQWQLGFANEFDEATRIWPWKSENPDIARNGYYHAMKDALERAKASHVTPNQLRHAFATRYAAVNLEGTRSQMGHRDIKTTRGYIDEDGRAARSLFDGV